MTWTLSTLDELGHVSRGRSRHRPRDSEHLYGGPYPFIQTGDVKHADLYITSYSQTYSEAGLAQSKLWPAGTLCITIAANIADTAILGLDACFPDSIIGFIPESGVANARFIKYLFDALLQRRYQQFTQGATQDNLSQAKLLSLRFPVPSIGEQQRIADILSAYDNLIENNRRRIQLLEQAARLLYKEWFVHLRFPGHEHVKVIDGVPEGWVNGTLTDFADQVNYGFTASAEPDPVGPKFLRITDIVPDVLDWTQVPYCQASDKDLERFVLVEGDVVVARTGATVGYAKRIGNITGDAVFASYLVRFRFNPQLSNVLAGVFMQSNSYKEYVRNNAGGAAQPNANARILGGARILIPPAATQDQFSDVVSNILTQQDVLQSQNQRLRNARDLLLPRLMNGEIAV
jgi:type I restriction enzyme S subunit